MPSTRRESSDSEEESMRSKKHPRRSRRDHAAVDYGENQGNDDGNNSNEDAARDDSSDIEILSSEAEEEDMDESDFECENFAVGKRRSARVAKKSTKTTEEPVRVSSRSNKTRTLMRDDDDDDDDDEGDDQNDDVSHASDDEESVTHVKLSTVEKASKHSKSPARRGKQRLSIESLGLASNYTDSEHEPDSDNDLDSDFEVEYVGKKKAKPPKKQLQLHDFEPFKISKIIAARTETRSDWKNICLKMNTSEVTHGSRWFQEEEDDDDDALEERFLIRWSDVSYLHCSWETRKDLVELIENAKTALTTFERQKDEDGLVYDADERCDGEYFDPGWRSVERILVVYFPEDCPIQSVDNEDEVTNEDLGICFDVDTPEYDNAIGRQLLIKWENRPYTDMSYEFERDLIINNVDYKGQIKAFNKRTNKSEQADVTKLHEHGEAELRRLYKEVFGENSDAKLESRVDDYQKALAEHTFPNGGRLRDYQAEGVSWLMANYVNKRSSILADEMGLGKTIQLAAFLNLLVTQLHRRGPFLLIVPLSTLCNWKRELDDWLGLNTIVYHGTAKNREVVRQLEMAFPSDRPEFTNANELYLRKCSKAHKNAKGNPWMAEVLITTPELLCAKDCAELTAVKWECLVVDEAHRLKNHASKFAVNLRDKKFHFKHKVLLTGTPIQNTMEELFALLNFVDSNLFGDCDEFLAKYGNIQSKEHIDELHEEIRPYILRRLKEDVEKSVPPKEETVIEVELTIAQKQYYRALYEKNVKFLHKNKRKPLDGPSLNNLAMQLRKCCNHLFLLNGIEDEFRAKQKSEGKLLLEGDILVSASGKLVLLDKLLPRLKKNGHRILIFSQFKIMLDVLEDYFQARDVNFERIDGSITGKKRQQAIDRFQAPSTEVREPPFVMLLSTRAGGVGINLTAADTCIIFDSDWNPQNDLQAQARCHRIGQTKTVKVYRLVTRKTYEMQMFHMSSLKLGLDQAVLSGFEAGSSGEKSMTKEEIERLLRHGAYAILNEEKDGKAAAASDEFVQQDIDTILERHSKTVIYENTGSGSAAAGGKFSKARFASAPAKSGDGSQENSHESVDIEDPDFWKKMLGEPTGEAGENDDILVPGKRARKVANYCEEEYDKRMSAKFNFDEDDDSDADKAKRLRGKDEGKNNDDDDDSFEEVEESESESEDEVFVDKVVQRPQPQPQQRQPNQPQQS